MSELAQKKITLNFRRMSKKTVDAMGYATLGIEAPEPPDNFQRFRAEDAAKVMREYEERKRELEKRIHLIDRQLKEEKKSFFGRLKNTMSGKEAHTRHELDKMQEEMIHLQKETADAAAYFHKRAWARETAAEMEAMKNAAPSPQPNFSRPPAPAP